jgi:multisubunit Na+/H+ antiporter MnhG subunit
VSDAAVTAHVPSARRRIETRHAMYLPAVAALTIEVATHLLDYGLDDLHVRLLDASSEWSWSHVVATTAFASAAAVAVFAARRRRGEARQWWILAALFSVLFADNVARAHEAVAEWPLSVLPALVGVAIGVVRLARDTPVFRVVLAGLGLLVTSFVIHVLGHALVHGAGWGPDTWGYQIKIALKEGTELAGWVLVVPALMRLSLGQTAGPRGR